MKVGDLIEMLRAYPNDDELEIQIFETVSGEYVDSTAAIGLVEGIILSLHSASTSRRKNSENSSSRSQKMSSPPSGDSFPVLTFLKTAF